MGFVQVRLEVVAVPRPSRSSNFWLEDIKRMANYFEVYVAFSVIDGF